MSFLQRDWTDAEKWVMGIASAVLLAGGATWWASLGGEVVAEIASHRDRYGRCIDAEVMIQNNTKTDANEVDVAFDVDHFTKQGFVLLEYGDEKSEMIAPGQKALLTRRPYMEILFTMDPKRNTLTVRTLKPGQYIHLFLGGESAGDRERYEARERLLISGDPDLMNKLRVISVTRKDGTVKVQRIVHCPAK